MQFQTSGLCEYKASHIHSSKKDWNETMGEIHKREGEIVWLSEKSDCNDSNLNGKGTKRRDIITVWTVMRLLSSLWWASIQYIQAYDYVIVPGWKSVGGNWWYQVFKIDLNYKTGKSENIAPHIVWHNQRKRENCFNNVAKHRFSGSSIFVKKVSKPVPHSDFP